MAEARVTPAKDHRSRCPRPEAPSVQELLRLLSRSADGVFAVDGAQRVIFWSSAAEELLDRPAAKALGRPCYEVVLGRDYQGHPFCRRHCPVIKAVRRGRSVSNYDVVCPRNGEEMWLNVSIVPVPPTPTHGPVAIHLVRDVSTRRRSERLAQITVETVTQFISESGTRDREYGPYPAPDPPLTPRELQVLRLLADGYGTQALAQRLGLGTATVRNHIQRLLAKLGVHTRLEAVVYAARHRLI